MKFNLLKFSENRKILFIDKFTKLMRIIYKINEDDDNMMGGEPIEKSNEDDSSIWTLHRYACRQLHTVFI